VLRIALFTETFLPKVDGIVNTLCHLLDHLAEREHANLLFAPQSSATRYAKTAVVTLPAVPWPSYPEFKIAWPFTDARPWLESFQPDVVHLVNPVFVGLAGLRAARQLGLPVVASYQTDLPGFARRWGWDIASHAVHGYLRWLHNQCDLTLTPSRVTQADLKANGFRRVKVWTRGVDTAHYHPTICAAMIWRTPMRLPTCLSFQRRTRRWATSCWRQWLPACLLSCRVPAVCSTMLWMANTGCSLRLNP
jgi:glycosyltransferase involved in cell wall biosynthesis